ncbi:site-specific DNA-methyltransferase [Bacillus sp. B-jedd]|uniref:site-specific DNA-methyltransferase n=1 Tax=Bacillus sp. B-jedd TaxID=1476857 RepID=UPI0005155C24|nr:site-specific DNA-methyltransferase [Bacillus sp. B-jedd]CEG26477.1 adenine-specific DNA methylase [Bacillus sp. B-jedd]
MEKLDGQSLDLAAQNIEAIKRLFPEVVAEGKIDFEKLKLALGEAVDSRKEKFEFSWHGKAEALKLAQTPSAGTLRPDRDSGKNWDETENLYIEGDNLEVLKLLQKSYFGKVKMIFIDPPYNTGKDFVYKDDFRDSIENYKRQTGQAMKANAETRGRYHTDWLNMMYPRLKLARNLLQENGVMFISLDDTEVANLRKMCDEIFGEDNFVANLVWQKKFSRANDAAYFSTMHDHILVYCKNSIHTNESGWKIGLLPRGDEIPQGYGNPDNDPRGVWTSVVLSAKSGSDKLLYEITTPSGRVCAPPSGRYWSVSKERFEELVRDNRIWFGVKGDGTPRLKTFLSEVQSGLRPNTILFHAEAGHNQEGKQETKALFDDVGVFDGPKPVRLLEFLLKTANLEDAEIVLDFFSGSATTAHAVMKLNSEDGLRRKFILVQLPELCDSGTEAYKAGFRTICEIGRERIRRAGEKVAAESERDDLDIGFKAFSLDSSNLKPWDPDFENLEQDLFNLEDNLKEDRTQDDLLHEILLKVGLPLTVPIEKADVGGKTVYSVGYGSLLVCLEDEIGLDVVNGMIRLKAEAFNPKVVFKESGFLNDAVKTNAIQTLRKNGINDVRSV